MSQGVTINIIANQTDASQSGQWFARDIHDVTVKTDDKFINDNTHVITIKQQGKPNTDPLHSVEFTGDGSSSISITWNLHATPIMNYFDGNRSSLKVDMEVRDTDADFVVAQWTPFIFAPINREDDVSPATVPESSSVSDYSIIQALSGAPKWVARNTWLGTILTKLRALGSLGSSGQVMKVNSDGDGFEFADESGGGVTSHTGLTDVNTDNHHTKYTDAEAQAAAESGVKLDDLQPPDDNTDLNASTTKHGLLRKLSGTATEVLNGAGSWIALKWSNFAADTLANLNSKVSDATLDDSSSTRPPTEHGDSAHNKDYTATGDNVSYGDVALSGQATLSLVTDSDSGASEPIDWTSGNKWAIMLTDNCSISFTDPAGTANLVLKLTQDSTGGRTVSWPSNVKWPGGSAPTLSTAAGAVDIISFWYDGTDYYGFASLNFS